MGIKLENRYSSFYRFMQRQKDDNEEILRQQEEWDDQPDHIKKLIEEERRHTEGRHSVLSHKYGCLPPIFAKTRVHKLIRTHSDDEELWEEN